jgi:hypothetical protein
MVLGLINEQGLSVAVLLARRFFKKSKFDGFDEKEAISFQKLGATFSENWYVEYTICA